MVSAFNKLYDMFIDNKGKVVFLVTILSIVGVILALVFGKLQLKEIGFTGPVLVPVQLTQNPTIAVTLVPTYTPTNIPSNTPTLTPTY